MGLFLRKECINLFPEALNYIQIYTEQVKNDLK